MAEFKYKAKDFKGKIKTGGITAKDKNAAISQLRSMRLTPIMIKADKDTFLSRIIYRDKKGNIQLQIGSGLPKIKDMAIFSKQFSLMVERGVPLIQTISILAENQKNVYFSRSLAKIQQKIENGSTLSAALAEYPKLFDNLYVSMVKAGEISGSLDVVMKDLVRYLEKSTKLRSQLRSAMIYPGIILFVAVSITYAIMVFLVPVFAQQYKDAGKPLPMVTQIVVDISDVLTLYKFHIVGGGFALITGIKKFKSSKVGKPIFDKMMLALPLTGEVVRAVAISRFTSTMSTMMASGVAIMEALGICAESSGNIVIEKFIQRVREKIGSGSTFAAPLAEGNLFPMMVVSMVAVGEQTGALDETLGKISEIYEEEVDSAVTNMSAMFQPLLMVGIGLMLGFVVIALYLPIFDQAQFAGGGNE